MFSSQYTENCTIHPEDKALTVETHHSCTESKKRPHGIWFLHTGGTAELNNSRKTGIASHRKKKRQQQKWQCNHPTSYFDFFHHKFIANCTINTDAKPPKKTQRKQSPLQLPRLTVAHMPTDSQANQDMSTSQESPATISKHLRQSKA